jgi:hypothetical protein
MHLVHIELTQYEIESQGQFKIISSQGIDHLLWLLAKENFKNPRGLDN